MLRINRLNRSKRLTMPVLVLSVLLHGCASQPKQVTKDEPTAGVLVADNSELKLSSPPKALQGHGFQTLVRGRHGDSRYEMLMQVEMGVDNIVMNGSTTSGAQLFEMLWFDKAPYRLTKSPMAKDIEVKYLLADFQLVHWPKEKLLNHLTGVDIIDKDNTRTIIRNGKPVVLIEHQQEFIAFEHLERRYRLTIKVLDKWQN